MREQRFALCTASATFLLLVVGGLVHATGSGLACPEAWFICHGSMFPRMIGGVLYEHGHRLVATTVGMMTIALCVLIWLRKPVDRSLRWLGLGAVALVSVQGSLGAMTVKYKLPWFVSSAHLGTSMLFFSLIVYLCFRTARPLARSEQLAPAGSRVRRLLLLATGAVYLQIVFGALVRHKGAGLACNVQMPLCAGSFWPSDGPGQLHMLHRYFALCVLALVIVSTGAASRWLRREGERGQPRPLVRWLSRSSHLVVTAQIALGVASVLTYLGISSVTLHLSCGALLLANLWALYLGTGPLGAPLVRTQSNAALALATTPATVRS